MIAIAALALSLQLGAVDRDFAVAKDDAYLLLAPTIVAPGYVATLAWSHDGARLAALRYSFALSRKQASALALGAASGMDDGLVKPQLTVWNSRLGESRIYAAPTGVWQLAWGPSNTILFLADTVEAGGRRKLLQSLHLSSGAIRQLYRAPDDQSLLLSAPSAFDQSIGLMEIPHDRGSKPPTVRLISNGSVSEPSTLPIGASARMEWSADGRTLLLKFGSTRTALTSEGLKDYHGPVTLPSLPKFNLQSESIADAGQILYLAPIGVEDRKRWAIVTSDADGGEIAPDYRHVAYLHKAHLLVRPIEKIPLAAYQERLATRERGTAMAKAMQLSSALQQYALVNGGVLPSGEGWQNSLSDFVKDTTGFNYTYSGGPVPASNVVIGFANGPGGRAVIYGDFKVRWIPN